MRELLRDAIEGRVTIDVVERRFPRSALVQLVAGILRFIEGEHDGSFAALERAAILNPAAEHTACGLAFERAMRLGRFREALVFAQRAQQVHSPLVWMRAQFGLAIALGDDPSVLAEEILAIEPHLPDVQVQLAVLHLRHARLSEAVAVVRAIDPFRSGDASLAALRVALLRAAGAVDEATTELAIARQNFDAVDEPAITLDVDGPVAPEWSANADRRRALGMLKSQQRPNPVHVSARALTPQEVDAFCQDGYVCLRGALDSGWRERWLEDAQQRLQQDPKRWVKDYAGGLDNYTPADVSTWRVARADVVGDQRVPVAELAPRAWAVIEQLLGDRGVATTHWSNYFIVNFGERDEPRYQPPQPGDKHWHVDAPHQLVWGNVHQALVGFVLFTDLAPRAGGTFLARGSHRAVARALQEGASMSDRTAARELSKHADHVEITGRAGDVVLAHALLVHAASPNPSGVARFMANPLIESKRSLRFEGDAPVERALR